MNAITRDLRAVPPGQWKVARVNGIIEVNLGKPTIEAVRKALGCTALDTVNVRTEAGRISGVVMMVDDTAAIDGKPVNPLADAVYQEQCVPGNPHHICGDVAFVNDEDFAP